VELSDTVSRPAKSSSSGSIDVNILVVLVVSKQPLKCTKHYSPPDSKISMGVSSSFFPDNDDIKLSGESR
jgi:hypothetical protein